MNLEPHHKLFLGICLLAGMTLGLGSFTFFYGHGLSYLSKDPQACANCHVMNHQYDGWIKSGHHHVATCNDCHLPKGFIGKWFAKARNGFNHSMAFTLENFHEPIRIKPSNLQILQDNCVRCHAVLVTDALAKDQGCLHCHRNVGHFPMN